MIQLFKLEIHDDNHSSLSLKYMLFWYYFITICWTRVFSAFVLAYFKTHSLSATLGCVLYVITQMIKMWILWSQAWSHLWSQYSHYMWSHPCPQPVIKPDITRLITPVTTCKSFYAWSQNIFTGGGFRIHVKITTCNLREIFGAN